MNFLFISAFCKAPLLEGCLKHLSGHKLPKDTQIVIGLNHYPVDKEANNEAIRHIAKEYGATLIDNGKDLGLHGSKNNVLKEVGAKDGDIIFGCDPDDRPSDCWQAMVDVMNVDHKVDVVACAWPLIHDYAQTRPQLYYQTSIGGHRVYELAGIEMFMVSAWRMSFVNSVGGFAQSFNFYGGLEASMFIKSQGRMRLVYLRDHDANFIPVDRNDETLFDKSYRAYKDAHVSQKFSGSYEEYLCRQQ